MTVSARGSCRSANNLITNVEEIFKKNEMCKTVAKNKKQCNLQKGCHWRYAHGFEYKFKQILKKHHPKPWLQEMGGGQVFFDYATVKNGLLFNTFTVTDSKDVAEKSKKLEKDKTKAVSGKIVKAKNHDKNRIFSLNTAYFFGGKNMENDDDDDDDDDGDDNNEDKEKSFVQEEEIKYLYKYCHCDSYLINIRMAK